MASIESNIKRLRTARKLTQEQLAEVLFVTRQAVSAWETGKALPDVEMLEKIANALECSMNEILYGIPSPEARYLRRRWAVIGAAIAAAVLLSLFALEHYGVIGTARNGIQYQFWNMNYSVGTEELGESCSLELDLGDLASNTGKVLYEDEQGCRIVVDYVEPCGNLGGYHISFAAQGVCTPRGGTMVSGCHNERREKKAYSVCLTASMYTTIGNTRYAPGRYYVQSSLTKNENFFGFHLFPPEAYKQDRDGALIAQALEAAGNKATVTVSGLTRLTTTRTGDRFA